MFDRDTCYQLKDRYLEDKESFMKEFFNKLDPDTQAALIKDWNFQARPKQRLLSHIGGKINKVFLTGGRGVGKTYAASNEIVQNIESEESQGRLSHWGVVMQNWSDAIEIGLEGASGFQGVLTNRGYIRARSKEHLSKGEYFMRSSPGLAGIDFAGGSSVKFISAEKPDGFTGKNFHNIWLDELGPYNNTELVWEKAKYSVRLAAKSNARTIYLITSTPRPKQLIKQLLFDDPTVHVIKGASHENRENLSPDYFTELEKDKGSRMYRQEVLGELLMDNPGALWTEESIIRIDKLPDDIVRTVVAVDPSVGGKSSDETGIVVVAKCAREKFYIVTDASVSGSCKDWAKAVVRTYHQYNCDRVIYEKNQGGKLIAESLANIDPTIPVKDVWASKGKRTRAEPQAALYELGKVYHVGTFQELEDQLLSYDPDAKGASPDRMDALVWGLHELNQSSRAKLYFI